MQDVIQRELKFCILEIAAFHATFAIPQTGHADRYAVVAAISQCVIRYQPTIERDQG